MGILLASTVAVAPASAHGGESGAQEGYIFVQQALGHLAHDTGPKGVAAAEANLVEMLSGPDQDGVDVGIVGQAQAALTAGRTDAAKQDLQESIAEAVNALAPASGEQTGTAVVGESLPGRAALTGTDWTLGGVSLLLLAAGVGLALWFRPAENMAQLRRRLTAAPSAGTDTRPGPPSTPGTALGDDRS